MHQSGAEALGVGRLKRQKKPPGANERDPAVLMVSMRQHAPKDDSALELIRYALERCAGIGADCSSQFGDRGYGRREADSGGLRRHLVVPSFFDSFLDGRIHRSLADGRNLDIWSLGPDRACFTHPVCANRVQQAALDYYWLYELQR